MAEDKLSLANLAEGALIERFEEELGKIIVNTQDPNTDAEKPRKIKIEVTFMPSEDRTIVSVSINTKCELVSAKPVQTNLFVGEERGQYAAMEIGKKNIPGQVVVEPNGDMVTQKIIKFNKENN